MLKKLLVGLISLNICFSSLAYAQYQPVDELSPEEVEMYMSSVEKKEKGLPTAVKWAGGTAALLGTAYMTRKIIKHYDIKISSYVVGTMDPKAYEVVMRHAEKKATSSAAKKAIKGEMLSESAAMKEYLAKQKRIGKLKKISKANYWKATKSMYVGNWSLAQKYMKKYGRAQDLIKALNTPFKKGQTMLVLSKRGKVLGQLNWTKAKRIGWAALVVYCAYNIFFGDNNKEETAISNNRMQLEREIRKVMREDVDEIAMFIINLPEDQQQVAYGILSENPALFNVVKKQIEEAYSVDNIQATKEYYEAVESSEYTDELNSSITDTLNSGGWNWELGF